MAQSGSAAASAAPTPEEKTFRAYNQAQGAHYAQTRADYHPSVYQVVLDQHASSGGQHELLLDIGCGPGNAARQLAPHFAHAIGLDASTGMIASARALGGTSGTGEEGIRWDVSGADELGARLQPPVSPQSVDLIVAANAAHWFDLPAFWRAAARQLKPGGSVAVWTSGDIRVHPSMPDAPGLQAKLDVIDNEQLLSYMEPGNLLVRGGYRDLPLPWTCTPQIPEFDEGTFFRKAWDIDDDFFDMGAVDLATLQKMLGTASHITRWRAAHPDDVSSERDITAVIRKVIEDHLHGAGVPKGEEKLKGAVKGVMLIVKKKQEADA